MRQAGRQLPGYRQTLRARQVLLSVEQFLVDAFQFLIGSGQFRGGLLHLTLELGLEILNALQHEIQMFRQLADFITAFHARPRIELSALSGLHHTDHFPDWAADASEEECMDHDQ